MRRLAVINGLRGIFIFAVVFRHLFEGSTDLRFGVIHVLHGFLPLPLVLYPMAPIVNTQEAVRGFFILSGFVLAMPYLDTRRTMHHLKDAMQYYHRRARRLLPLLLVVLLSATAIGFWHHHTEAFLSRLLSNVHDVFIADGGVLGPRDDGPLWSIRLELWFSLLLPPLLLLRQRFGTSWLLVASVLLTISTLFLQRSVLWWVFPSAISDVALRLSDFVFGIAVAECSLHRRMPSPRVALLYGFALVCGGLVFEQYARIFLTSVPDVFSPFILCSGFSMLLATFVTEESPSFLHRILACWPLQMLGLMSYSLYVWHIPFFNVTHPLAHPWQIVASILGLLIFSFLSYRFLEFPQVRDWTKLLPERSTKTALA